MNEIEKQLQNQALMYFVVRACEQVGKRMVHLKELQGFCKDNRGKNFYAQMIDDELAAFDLACAQAYPDNLSLHAYMAELVDYHSGNAHWEYQSKMVGDND